MAGRTMVAVVMLAGLTAPGFAADQGGRTSDISVVTNEGIVVGDEGWGTATTTTVALSAYDFEPFRLTGAVTGVSDDGNGFSWATGGANKIFIAGVPVPSGAEIERVGIWYCDNVATGAFEIRLYEIMADGGFNTIDSTIFPNRVGCGLSVNAADLNYLFNSNSGRNIQIYLFQTGTAVAGEVKFRGAEVRYRLRVSAAPAVATFPNDTPTTHPFFRFVEAMAASGLTGGCAAGSFCPDNPVTRGQMAVFLSTALGLHFPN